MVSSIIHNYSMEAAHVSIDEMHEKQVAYTYRRTLFSLGKEGNSDTLLPGWSLKTKLTLRLHEISQDKNLT